MIASYITPSMSTTKLEGGIVSVDGTSNQAVIQRFSRTFAWHTFEFPEAWVLYFKTGPSFVG